MIDNKILVCNDSLKKLISQLYEYKIIDENRTAQILQITANK